MKNWIVLGEIQTSTTAFIACLNRFRLTSHPSKIPIESPQAHGDSSQSPYSSHTHGNPHGDPHTHGSPGPTADVVYATHQALTSLPN